MYFEKARYPAWETPVQRRCLRCFSWTPCHWHNLRCSKNIKKHVLCLTASEGSIINWNDRPSPCLTKFDCAPVYHPRERKLLLAFRQAKSRYTRAKEESNWQHYYTGPTNAVHLLLFHLFSISDPACDLGLNCTKKGCLTHDSQTRKRKACAPFRMSAASL